MLSRWKGFEVVVERRSIADRYNEAFSDLEWLGLPADLAGREHGYQSYPCLLKQELVSIENVQKLNAARNNWMDELQVNGISTRPATHCIC